MTLKKTINASKCHSVARHDIRQHSGQTSEDVRVGLNCRVQTEGDTRIATEFLRSTRGKTRVFPSQVDDMRLFCVESRP